MMCNKIRCVLFGGSTPDSPWADAGLTVLRVGAGLAMAIAHGYGKIFRTLEDGGMAFGPSDQMISGVESMGFPLPTLFAWAAALSEFLGGLLLAIGLATRPAAFFLLCTMATAFFVVHAEDAFGIKERAFLYGIITIGFLLAGSGRFGVDRFLRQKSVSSTGD